jgi:DNA-binding GntR family transcriptional regulator
MAGAHAKRTAGAGKAGKAPGTAVRGGSLVARAYDEIKEKILTLYFLPGQYLNEGAVSALLGVGRTPVHQALQRLQVEGLVEIMPRKGVIVLPDSIGEIIKILESRAAVEAELARSAAQHATPEQARALQALARTAKPDAATSEIDAFIAGDRAFHRLLAELAGNPVLSEFAQKLHERSIRYWYLHFWQTIDVRATSRQHGAIADAIARRDGETAAEALREHIVSLKSRLLQVQSRSGHAAPTMPTTIVRKSKQRSPT